MNFRSIRIRSIPQMPVLFREFESQQQGEMFTVALSRDLFDRARKINIKLDCPKPFVRAKFGILSDIKYTASISQRMEYYDLPNWDQIRKRFADPVPPVLTVRRASDRKIVYSKPMEDGCMASRWWGDLRFVKFESGSTYEFSVIDDSGGLFPPMESTYDFTFKKKLHRSSKR